MSSKMKRFFSTSQKTSDPGLAADGVPVNPLPSMADLALNNGHGNFGPARSSSPPPPPIFAGYMGGAGGPGSGIAPPNGTAVPPQYQTPGQLYQFAPQNGLQNHNHNGMDGGHGHRHGYSNSFNGSNGGIAPVGAASVNGSANGNANGYSYGDISFLNAMPPQSVAGTVDGGDNYNNVPPPPRSVSGPPVAAPVAAGSLAASLSSAGQSTKSLPSKYPTPPPQYGQQPQPQPQHQPSYNSLYQQQPQYEKFSTGLGGVSSPFLPRGHNMPPPQAHQPHQPHQPYQHQEPPPHRKGHRLLGSKSKHHLAVSPVAQPVPSPAAHPTAQKTPQQQAMTSVDVTAADIRDTTYMLRQLYKMELFIHGERYAIHADDQAERREVRRKADLLREEIENNVNSWNMTAGARWTREELEHVRYSMRLIGSLKTLGASEEDAM